MPNLMIDLRAMVDKVKQKTSGALPTHTADLVTARVLYFDPQHQKYGIGLSSKLEALNWTAHGPINNQRTLSLSLDSARLQQKDEITLLGWRLDNQFVTSGLNGMDFDACSNDPDPGGFLAVQVDTTLTQPALINLTPYETTGLGLLLPDHIRILGAAWWGNPKNVPDLYNENGVLMPQHPDKLALRWSLHEQFSHPPEKLVKAIYNRKPSMDSDPLFRLLFALFLDGILPYPELPDKDYLPANVLYEQVALLAKDAAGISLRVVDGRLVTLAELMPLLLERINPDSASQWVELLHHEAEVMRDKAAILEIYEQMANLKSIKPT